jgi:signal transduction histidine kinase
MGIGQVSARTLARAALPLLIAIAGVVAALQLGQIERSREAARMQVRSGDAARAIQSQIADYTDVLYGIRALYHASHAVGAREFAAQVRATDVSERFPSARGIGVAERVGPRLVIRYVAPRGANRSAIGQDVAAWPEGRRAAHRSFATGRPTVTGPIRLQHGRGDGFLVFLRVHTRRFDGIAIVMVATHRLVDDAVPFAPPADLALYDLGPVESASGSPSPATRTFATGEGADAAPHGQRTVLFSELGRHWALRYAPRQEVLARTERAAPWIALAAGLLLAGLAAWLLTASARTERRAVALASRMTADLARSNAELERFASVASHDLREPLRSVAGFMRLLERRRGTELDIEARAWIASALDGTRRMSALIGDLLEYSRAGVGEPDATGDLQVAWDTATRNLSAAIRDAGAAVTADPLPPVAASQAELNQVVQNLLANAIKYRGEAAPVVHASAVRRGRAWALTVTDNGIGIDPRHHERVFELFGRLHREDEYEGTGMGLSLVKKVAEARGGSVSVESAPGEGARFTVVLPAAAPDVPAIRAA